MREIKFRGYAVEELVGSQWITDGYGVSKIEYIDGTSSVYLLTPYGDYVVHEESVGQYTGVKDDNGNEICEGNIIKIQSMLHDNSLVYIGKVLFENGMYICESKWNKHWIGELGLSKEIIGSVYENPELLEG